jgi:hypothetical protein
LLDGHNSDAISCLYYEVWIQLCPYVRTLNDGKPLHMSQVLTRREFSVVQVLTWDAKWWALKSDCFIL